jgi:beta-hydroxylase
MIFDDTYLHEVWNDTDGQRVVLFIDFVRPFSEPVATINEFIIKLVTLSPFVQNARKNQAAWEKRQAAAMRS